MNNGGKGINVDGQTRIKLFKEASSVILAGPCPLQGHSWLSQKTDYPVIFVDGGINKRRSGTSSCLVLGDGDSGSSPDQQDITFPSNKNFSDLKGALDLLTNASHLMLEGFLGGRRDHELLVLGEIHHWAARSSHSSLIASLEDRIWCLKGGPYLFRGDGVFSLVAFQETTPQLSGHVDYPLDGKTPLAALSSMGLSNFCRGELSLSSTDPVFLMTEESWEMNS